MCISNSSYYCPFRVKKTFLKGMWGLISCNLDPLSSGYVSSVPRGPDKRGENVLSRDNSTQFEGNHYKICTIANTSVL